MPDVLRGVGATLVVFGVSGFGVVRLLLPAPLRRYELLWTLPAGGCAAGLALTLLGFAGVPYSASLPIVLALGLAAAAYAVWKRGWPGRPRGLAWPVYLGLVVLAVALVPVFAQHYAAPVGNGQDSHLAAGAANLLQHDYPTSTDISLPVNRMPPTWQSKFPIYYALAAVSSVAGLATWQALAIVAAALLGLAAIGFFLLARDVLGVPVGAAAAGMALAGLDREALHTVLNPYFNQTWGFFAMPFTVVLGWWAVQPGLGRQARAGVVALLAVFALVLVFAYPLAAPIPAVPLVVFAWRERRRRIAAGEPVVRLAAAWRGARSLVWIVPLAALLAFPAAGAVHKAVGAAGVLLPGHSLIVWGGDLGGFVPFNDFFSLPSSIVALPLVIGVLGLSAYGLARENATLRWGLGGLLALGIVVALYFRLRQYGWYFHFKLLAFIGPLVLLIAAAGALRLRRYGGVIIAALGVATAYSTFTYIRNMGHQLQPTTIQLGSWAKTLPRGASVRLDMWPPLELWAAYFLDSHPLCSQQPLLDTDYPHVPVSRQADYIVASRAYGRPGDAVGGPLRENAVFRLYRESPAVPGPSLCSLRRLDRIYNGLGYSGR